MASKTGWINSMHDRVLRWLASIRRLDETDSAPLLDVLGVPRMPDGTFDLLDAVRDVGQVDGGDTSGGNVSNAGDVRAHSTESFVPHPAPAAREGLRRHLQSSGGFQLLDTGGQCASPVLSLSE